MAKQIILHYPGSYVERPHTLIFDDKDEYQEFLQKKSYKLKPNVKYGVFTLGAVISTEYAGNKLDIEVLDKSDWTFNFPEQEAPEIDIKVPEEPKEDKEPEVKDPEQTGTDTPTPTEPKGDGDGQDTAPEIKGDEDEVIIINPDENQGGTPEAKEEDDVIIINPDEDDGTQNPTEGNTDENGTEEKKEPEIIETNDDDDILIFD